MEECARHDTHDRRRRVGGAAILACLTGMVPVLAIAAQKPLSPRSHLERPLLITQLPVGTESERKGSPAGGMLHAAYGHGGRLLIVPPDSSSRVASRGFHSACDPEVSFDATRIMFAGKRRASDNWNIYEMQVDGSRVRQITRGIGDCRHPGYQSPLYTIVSPRPWYQITFVSAAAGTMNEYGPVPATHLYSCKVDGSGVSRLTYNLSSDVDPCIMQDGRLLFGAWQRRTLDRGLRGRMNLVGVNIDGTDYAAFAGDQGRRVKHMPCVTTRGLAVFVEADVLPWDGSGCLSCVSLRRPLHHYRPITGTRDGLFHTPSPLPDGTVLVSRRPGDGSGTHGVWRLEPSSGRHELVFDDPDYHDVQAKLIHPRPEPDGRSSVVSAKDPYGKLYCLSVYLSDLEDPAWMPPGSVERIRVLEGLPLRANRADAYLRPTKEFPDAKPGSTAGCIPPLARRRILGEIPLEQDGSFHLTVPANTPIEIQILDARGMALRSCGWIWARNHEPRGCIGCHEDPELTPENRLTEAVARPSIPLILPPARRRTVDFRRDVMPILLRKCVGCHGTEDDPPQLHDARPVATSEKRMPFNLAYRNLLATHGSGQRFSGKYVQPGKARTSPLIWHVFGRNTSRPWDGPARQGRAAPIPPGRLPALTEDEKRTLVEWIDMGALWEGIAGPDDLSAQDNRNSGVSR